MTTDERREGFRKLAAKIAGMTDDQRKELASKCVATCIEGRGFSFANTCLIAHQRPDATLVGGFRQWIKAGRAVRKGEHGFGIWVPIPRRRDDGEIDRDAKPRFMMGTVFDVSQTEEIGSAVAAA